MNRMQLCSFYTREACNGSNNEAKPYRTVDWTRSKNNTKSSNIWALLHTTFILLVRFFWINSFIVCHSVLIENQIEQVVYMKPTLCTEKYGQRKEFRIINNIIKCRYYMRHIPQTNSWLGSATHTHMSTYSFLHTSTHKWDHALLCIFPPAHSVSVIPHTHTHTHTHTSEYSTLITLHTSTTGTLSCITLHTSTCT